MKKQIVILILIFAVLLTGCARDSVSDSDFDSSEFIYTTEIVPFPRLPDWLPNIGDVAFGEDKVYFTAWGRGGDMRFNTPSLFAMNFDGSGLAELPNQRMESVPPDIEFGFMSINALYIDVDGNIWTVETGNYDVQIPIGGATSFFTVRKMDRDGSTLQEIDISSVLRVDGSYQYVTAFCVDASENIYIATSTAIHVLDSQGNALFNLTTQDYLMHLTRLSDGTVAHFSRQPGGTRLQRINAAGRGWGETIRLPSDAYSVFPGNDDYLVFFNIGVNLFGIDIESGDAEFVLNWLDSGVLASGVTNLVIQPDGHILVSLQVQRGAMSAMDIIFSTELVRLSKTLYSELPERTTLTLGTLHPDHIIQNAVVRFNMTSKTHRIHVIDYSSFNTSEDSTAGLTRLTTEIVAGRSPDILVLTGLPFGSYVSRGMFVDLYPFLDDDPVLSRNGIIESVLREDEIDGKLYRIIPGFAIQTIIGRASVLGDGPGWTMDEFLAVLEENPQADLPLGTTFKNQDFLRISLMHTINDYIDRETGTVNFDKDSFIQLLELADTFPAENVFSSFEPILSGRQIMLSKSFGDIFVFMHDRAIFGTGTIFKGFPTENKGGHVLVPHESIAITTGCRDTEGAWSFIRSMLLDDFQRNFITWSFPVNRLVFDERIDIAMDERGTTYITGLGGYDGAVEIRVHPISRMEANMVEVLLDSLIIVPEDEVLWNIVSESAAGFFDGRISAQDAARIIQSRASIYISEQS